MYSYDWDMETGGLLLDSSPLIFSKEPRPVYYKELDILGFDRYWHYVKCDNYPYMWAEANNYWYRGKLVAKTKGGSIYTKPEIVLITEPEKNGQQLRPVDILTMVKKNKEMIGKIAAETIKNTYNTFVEYKHKIDVFYVAFSGGKDSIVTLDIVQRALPHNEFKVLFGDTGMEFPDTYKTISLIENDCIKQGIEFIRAKSDMPSIESWKNFGPPATVTRWCCSVHKTAPQILALREKTKKPNFTGMAFVGIRASESVSRSEYEYVSLGEKHKGQYSCNPIIEWNTAELYVYLYSQNLRMNETYKKGNSRAGCLVCPSVSEKNSFFRRTSYQKEFDVYLNLIAQMYSDSIPQARLHGFLENTGWKSRMNGRDIFPSVWCNESSNVNKIIINVRHPKVDWKEWMKTLGVLIKEKSPYTVLFNGDEFEFSIVNVEEGYDVLIDKELSKTFPVFIKHFRNVFRRASACVGCHTCEVDCPYGYISMTGGQVTVSNQCTHCLQCHKVEKGCLVYKSLELPKGGFRMETKSLNCYSTHAPKMEWMKQYFELQNDFITNNSLGSQMFSFFKRFLRDAELIDGDNFNQLAEKIYALSLESQLSWGIILTNLAYSTQIRWYIKNIKMNEISKKEYIAILLMDSGANERAANDIIRSFVRFTELPFKEVGMGYSEKDKQRVVSITRTPWQNADPLVVLYALYKFAENCGDYYQFTLSRLLNHDIESTGVSPTEIFGIDRERMEKIANGLAINHPEYISASFTLDLDNITLRSDKSSEDILDLF